ncbi:MAG: DUF2156 domain-containing protein [Spirochaetales bacterium]
MPIPTYPDFAPITLDMRGELHPWFQTLEAGLSEFTFSNIFLFRHNYDYQLSRFAEGKYLILGAKNGRTFFSAPWGPPSLEIVQELLRKVDFYKNLNESQVAQHGPEYEAAGYQLVEDRDNFDYLYDSTEMATLDGKKFHKKRNHIHQFFAAYPAGFEGRDMTSAAADTEAALAVLEHWQSSREDRSDYLPSKDAIYLRDELELAGRIWTLNGRTVGFAQGEPTQLGQTFTIHFEKADGFEYKGVYQAIFFDWAGLLKDRFALINREQDLGDPGLRQAKETYRPVGFVRKYRVEKAPPA